MGIIIRIDLVEPPGDNGEDDMVEVIMVVKVMMMVAVMVMKVMMVVVVVEIRLERVRPPGDYSLQAKSGSAVGCVCLV